MDCLLGPKTAAPVGRWPLWNILWVNLFANQITALPKCFVEVVGRVTEKRSKLQNCSSSIT